MRRIATPSLLALAATLSAGAVRLEAQAGRQALSPSGPITTAEAMSRLQTLIDQAAPSGLSAEDQAAYQVQTEWLRGVLTRLDRTVQSVAGPREQATGQATGQRQAQPAKVTPEIEAFRRVVEEEGRKFSTASAALKSRHEAAMSAIRNMR